MLSELSSGEYRYPDLRFIVTIHHVFSWWIFGIGEVRSVVSKLLRFACFVFFSARIHLDLNPCHIISTRRWPNRLRSDCRKGRTEQLSLLSFRISKCVRIVFSEKKTKEQGVGNLNLGQTKLIYAWSHDRDFGPNNNTILT